MSDFERISPEDALERMEDDGWAYLDVRTVAEFEGGHPEGAYNIPWKHQSGGGMVDNEDFLAVTEAAFPKDAKLIVGCKSGGRSRAAAEALVAAGFTNIVDQRAGYVGARNAFGQMDEAGWQTAGLPIGSEAEAGRDYESLKAKLG